MSSPKKQDLPPSFWRNYRFELMWAVAILLGLFLLFERMAIRPTLRRWLAAFGQGVSSGFSTVASAIIDRVKHLSASDALGLALVIVALGVLAYRIRWRLLHTPTLTSRQCPRCGSVLHRVHRHQLDRLLDRFVAVRRYYCQNPECRWSGLRFGRSPQDRKRTSSAQS